MGSSNETGSEILKGLNVHHIGYLVKNINKAGEMFSLLGFEVASELTYDEYRQINIQFMQKDGYMIELVEPADKESVVGKLLKKSGSSPYHICYEVEDLEAVTACLRKKSFVLWEEPHPAPAIEGRDVVFLYSSRIGLI